MRFIRYNANPKGWKTGDCVIRAVAAATQQTWDDVYDDLCAIGKKKGRMPNESYSYGAYLKEKGFTEEKQLKHSNGNWYTIEEVVKTYPNSILIMHCSHHLTVAINGVIIDLWNTSYKSAGKFWKKDITEDNVSDVMQYLDFVEENRLVERRRLI